MISTDICIVGAGMAGASLAARIAGEARVVMIEAEDQPGYHSTGRSAAFFSETYGGPAVQPLTTASRPFFEQPPNGFTEVPLIGPRGCLHIARAEDVSLLEEMDRLYAGLDIGLTPVDAAALHGLVPRLGPQWVAARDEPGCRDLDVAALHGGFLRQARRGGAVLRLDSRLTGARRQAGRWLVETTGGAIDAAIIVNAAGAWADDVAGRCGAPMLGMQPLRRTMVQITVDEPVRGDLPLVMEAGGRFYFKPEAGGRLWLTPHDEIPQPPGDAAADELDVALAIERFARATDWRVDRVERRWAGLRTFAPDRAPVYGFDPRCPGFFWCAGQGGFGIQTAPAAAALAAALLLEAAPAPFVAHIDAARYAPARFGGR
jgi:D-arginine dehydrogenase